MLPRFPISLAFGLALGLAPITRLSAATLSPPTVFTGMCDASGAVALDADHFAVANDEDNVIRIYRAMDGGAPVQAFDVSGFLKVDPRKPETDLEGACWLGNKAFWIGSHGRNRSGKFRPNRDYLFATTFVKTNGGFELVPAGQPYTHLLADLIAEPRLKRFKLDAASQLAPKAPGALNIEGIAGTPDGHLLIGFRNPIPGDRALVVPLLNPEEILIGQRARLGDPLLLDLGGRGVRDLARWQDGYLISAGPFNGEGSFALYTWAGGQATPKLIPGIKLKHFHAEAIIAYPDRPGMFQLLSDDGTRDFDGTACKDLPDPNQRQFRSLWVLLPNADAGQ